MLTKKQKKVLDYIQVYSQKHGFAPSHEEMRKHLKLASVSTINHYLKILQKKKYIAREKKVARAVSIDNKESIVSIPFKGYIAAGVPIEAVQEYETVNVPSNLISSSGEHFALGVRGDSMIDEGILDGDTVVIRKQNTVENGETAVALINGNEVTLKKIYKEKNRIRLQPANPKLKPLFVKSVVIQGKVVSTFRNFEEQDKQVNEIRKLFSDIKIDYSWSFSDKTRKDTAYITHGYHRYPAKFIPQIVSRLAEKYTRKGDLIVDPFGGCGTTLVESKVMGRPSIAVDINPVAVLIAKAKITPIDPDRVKEEYLILQQRLEIYNENTKVKVPEHTRIDYWFQPEEKRKLTFLLAEISRIKDKNVQDFFFCGFSNILKNCSIWLQKSNKPTRDFEKTPSEPFKTFAKQIRMMLRGNTQLFELLSERGYCKIPSKVVCTDARTIPVKDNGVSLIVTSPPYVTSYEYADLHQLTAFWLEYTKDLSDFRKRFIGTSYHNKKNLTLNSSIAENIRKELSQKDRKIAEEVSTYFSEMNQVFAEMKRILRKGGKTCIVVGNTNLKGVEISNAEVFVEQLQNLGLKVSDIIKREIPSKNLPSVRDEKTGKFARITSNNKVLAYPTEYILVMEK
ncbi:MAG: methylase N-4/N-6 domain protein [Parcubacteria group bacterium GW2011_GWA2_49_9]|nr:MAG: methylase N-4/N-6 domain protein [Parcubacteria group bacterium GW2011_GWA2_49_9]